MGQKLQGLERVSLRELSRNVKSQLIMGVDSAISYHGYGNAFFEAHPIIVTDKIAVGRVFRGEPWIVGIRTPRELLDTNYPDIKVTNIVDSILDTMEFNKYSENIVEALCWLRNDKAVIDELTDEAKKRGLSELLEWEWREMREYFNY